MSEILQVNFRMPAELKEKLENSAKENGRSITSELVTRLEQSFNQPQNIALPDFVKQGLVDIINTQLANAQKEIEEKVKTLKNLDEKDVEEFIEYQLNKRN
ncbi:conserved hypothetical protein [Moraxellaceae bacterium 17A]|nr:conserved hypothetical protein [Moraxellaceae bacterium 17A]